MRGNRPEFRKPDNGNENKMIYLASHNILFDFCLSRIACCYTAIILYYYMQRFRCGNDETMNISHRRDKKIIYDRTTCTNVHNIIITVCIYIMRTYRARRENGIFQ